MSVNTPTTSAADFGSNQWLVEEMYEQYKSDKNSVDRTWWPVFEKFEAAGGGTNGSEAPASKPAPAAQQAPSAKQAPAPAAQKGSPQKEIGRAHV